MASPSRSARCSQSAPSSEPDAPVPPARISGEHPHYQQSQILGDRGEDIDKVLLLEVPGDVLLARMLARGRSDDTVEAIGRRLQLYRTETKTRCWTTTPANWP